MNDEVVFRKPPKVTGRGRSGHWEEVALSLRAHPGEWGFVGRRSTGLPANIRKGAIRSFPPDEFEVTQRRTKDNRADVYIRYVGPNGEYAYEEDEEEQEEMEEVPEGTVRFQKP